MAHQLGLMSGMHSTFVSPIEELLECGVVAPVRKTDTTAGDVGTNHITLCNPTSPHSENCTAPGRLLRPVGGVQFLVLELNMDTHKCVVCFCSLLNSLPTDMSQNL